MPEKTIAGTIHMMGVTVMLAFSELLCFDVNEILSGDCGDDFGRMPYNHRLCSYRNQFFGTIESVDLLESSSFAASEKLFRLDSAPKAVESDSERGTLLVVEK